MHEQMFAVAVLSFFLLLGVFIREKITIIQKLFIPASIVGGVLLLICGPQVLNIVDITAAVKSYITNLIIIVLTCIVFGNAMDRKRLHSYADFTVVNMATYGLQLVCGLALGWVLSVIWNGLPTNWGIMGVYSFWGGPGTAASTGGFYANAGQEDYLGLALFCATVGLVSSMTVGMCVVNWGVKRGYCSYIDKPEKLPEHFYGGILPQEEQLPIGREKTSSSGINAIALQLAFIMLCILCGWGFKQLGARFISPAFLEIDSLVDGVIGAVIIWPLMSKSKAAAYVDKSTVNSISGLCLDYLIVVAMGTLRLETITSYIIPVIIFCLICVPLFTAQCIILSAKFCRDDWFEKMINNLGQVLGSTPTGLALLRCVDPNFKSCSADAGGVAAAITMPIWVTMIAVGPEMALSPNGAFKVLGIGTAITIVSIVIGFMFFYVKDRGMWGNKK